jgi:hypothetical protein
MHLDSIHVCVSLTQSAKLNSKIHTLVIRNGMYVHIDSQSVGSLFVKGMDIGAMEFAHTGMIYVSHDVKYYVSVCMKVAHYRSNGTHNSIYADSSSDEELVESTKDKTDTSIDDNDTGVQEKACLNSAWNEHHKTTTQDCNGVTYKANFRPTHTALCVVLDHIRTVKQEEHDNEVVSSTLCSNVLIETGNRLNLFLSRAKLMSLKNLCLSTVISYNIRGKQTRPTCTTPIDTLTGKPVTSKHVYEVELICANGHTRFLSFEKIKAMYTVVSWIRVFTFNDGIRALNIPTSKIHLKSKIVQNICFDFLQCVRQALYTLQISTGTIRKEQLFLSGDTNMDTLIYYTPLSDTRMHSGGFSKYPLILYPIKPLTGKRKRGHVQKTQPV